MKRCVGRGGMGAVFLAYDEVMKGNRAIKVLDPALMVHTEARARFRTEAIAMSQLNHPHVIRVFDQGQEGLTSYIVMEYVAGGSLRARLRQGPLDREVALSLCMDVADGLHHAHERGVIHRDIKPDNILLDVQGAKLTDFGIARVLDVGPGLTRSRAVLGTPAFMSPEQRMDGKRCTPRADLYSLAATLFVLLTDRDPIDLYEPTAREHLLADLDPAVAEVIRTGVQADPEDRFPSARAMAAALDAARASPGEARSRPTTGPGLSDHETADLAELQRVWRSYVTPPAPVAGGGGATVGATYGVGPETVPPTADAPYASPAAPPPAAPALPPPSASRGRRWPLVAAVAVGLSVGAVGIWMARPAPDPRAVSVAVSFGPSDGVDAPDADAAAAWGAPAAREALLAADPDRVQRLLHDAPVAGAGAAGSHLLQALTDALEGDAGASRRALGRGLAAGSGADPRVSEVLRLGAASMAVGPDGPALMVEWEALRASQPADPLVALSHLLFAEPLLGAEGAASARAVAQERHATHAAFALLTVRRDPRPPADAGRLAVLDAALAAHPTAPALVAERCHALLWQGRLEAAGECIGRLETLAPGSTTTSVLQATLAARTGDVESRNTALLMGVDDTVPLRGQFTFLLALGDTMASLGQLQEARKLWTLAADFAQDAGETASLAELGLRDLEAALLLGVPPAEDASVEHLRPLIEAAEGASVRGGGPLARLLLADGRAAVRAGDPDLARLRLDALQGGAGTAAEAELLAIELAAAGGAERPAALAARAQAGAGSLLATCRWVGLRARLAAAAGDAPALETLATRLADGACRGAAAERELLALEAQLRVAESPACGADTRASARAWLASRAERWADADASIPLRARLLEAVAPAR